MIVAGPANAEHDIQHVSGVQRVAQDVAYEIGEAPVAPADANPAPRYADRQWDKQVTEAFEAHETATGEGTRLAIMDTGVDASHPDLEDNVNTELGRSFINGEIGTDTSPVHPHGTHTAGIAGATGEVGVVGMAPDTEIVPLRVFPEEGPLIEKVSDCLLAFDYAAEIGADAVNVSLGWDPRPPQENQVARGVRRVICERVVRRGTTAVVSAGNADWDLQHGGYRYLWTSLQSTVGVSATGPNNKRAFYSNYGVHDIDVGAPGGGYETIEKTLSVDTEWPYPTNLVLSTVPGGDYAYYLGTSMASPQVTGLVGLLREVAPTATPAQVERTIKQSADLVPGKSDPELGAGRINAKQTVESSAPGHRKGHSD